MVVRRRGSRIFYNRPIDGGEVVNHKRRPPFTPQENTWYSFLLDAESTPGWLEGLGNQGSWKNRPSQQLF
jgi:hypothetical protein